MLMLRFAIVIALCYLLVFGQVHGRSTGGNLSALPYLLSGDRKDVCLDENTFKAKSECLQALLENYYSENFTWLCPSLPTILVVGKCRGCPWDRVNVSMLNPNVARQLNRAELFHPASASCSIANHVKEYQSYGIIRQHVFGIGILGTLLLFLVTAYYSVSSSSDVVIENGAVIFGHKVSEPLFLLTLWICYHAGSLLLIVSEDYVEFCEGESERIFQEAARISCYAIVVMISLARCRGLCAVGFDVDEVDEEHQSWSRYLRSAGKGSRKAVLSFFLGPAVAIYFVVELLMAPGSSPSLLVYGERICYAGAKDVSHFTNQIMKVLLEMFAVVVYAWGPSRKRRLFYLRYLVFVGSLLASGILIGLVYSRYIAIDITFMMIPRIADAKIALPFTNLVHFICVTLMGLLEPIRIGWPSRSKKETNL